jgi:hypothetical protein
VIATDIINDLEIQRMVAKTALQRVLELEDALSRMVRAHERLSADTEGQYPYADTGCVECTAGVTPDRYNTGPCAYHASKRLLGQS